MTENAALQILSILSNQSGAALAQSSIGADRELEKAKRDLLLKAMQTLMGSQTKRKNAQPNKRL